MTSFEELTESFSRLPGIGKKTAARLTAFILRSDESWAKRFGEQIATLQEKTKICSICGAWTEQDPCEICSDSLRSSEILCVVEQPQDVHIIEQSREFDGLFHVLGGTISPLDGIGPDKLRISNLVERVKKNHIKEVILAMNPTVEGDTTALYIQHMLSQFSDLIVSRLASGLPVGGDLEYADKLTLARSFRGRTKL